MALFNSYFERKLNELIKAIQLNSSGDVTLLNNLAVSDISAEDISADSVTTDSLTVATSSPATTNVPLILDKTGAETVIQNTVTETAFYSYTIPGGILSSTSGWELSLAGAYTNTTGLNRTFTLRVNLGGNNYYADVTPNIATGSPERTWMLSLWFKNLGSTSTNRLHGRFEMAAAGTTTAGLGDLSAAKLIDMVIGAQGASPNLNTGNDLLLELTVEHSNNDTGFFSHGGWLERK